MGMKVQVEGDARKLGGAWRGAPSEAGLVGMWWLGDTVESSIANRIPGGGPPAIVYGSPVVTPYSMQFKTGVNYLGLPLLDTAAMTWVIVGRALGTPGAGLDTRCVMMGTTEAGDAGANLFLNASPATSWTFGAYRKIRETGLSVGRSDQGNGVGSTTNIHCLIADTDLTEDGYFKSVNLADMTGTGGGGSGADRGSNAIVAGYDRIAGKPIYLGGRPSAFSGPSEVFMAAVFNRAITADERTKWYAALKGVFANYGIPI